MTLFVVTIIGFASAEIPLNETIGSVSVTLNVTGADLELETIVVRISTHDISANGWLVGCTSFSYSSFVVNTFLQEDQITMLSLISSSLSVQIYSS